MRFVQPGENWLIIAGELEERGYLALRPSLLKLDDMREALAKQYPDRTFYVQDHGTIIAIRRLVERHVQARKEREREANNN